MGLYDFNKSEKNLQQSLKILISNIGDFHPEVSRVLHRLGALYIELMKFDEAHKYLLRGKEIRVNKLGAESSRVAQSLRHLVTLYETREQYNEAIDVCSQSLSIMKKRFGETHERVVPIIKRLSSLYWVKGDLNRAKEYAKEALEKEKKLNLDNEEIEDTQNLLKNIIQGPYKLCLKPITIPSEVPPQQQTKRTPHPLKVDIERKDKKQLRKVLIPDYDARLMAERMLFGLK